MKFSIVTAGDQRQAHKRAIREKLEMAEVFLPTYTREENHHAELYIRGMNYYPNLTETEYAIWYAHWDRWEWLYNHPEPLLVFEDDAVLDDAFVWRMNEMIKELPKDWDYLSLWVPPDQKVDYIYDVEYTEDGQMIHLGPNRNPITSVYNYGGIRTCKVYQGYGLVATLYAPSAGRKLVELTLDYQGMPVDCAIHTWAHQGKLNGYAPKPHHARLVSHDYDIASIRSQNAI